MLLRAFDAFDRQAAADAKIDQLIAAASRLSNRRGIEGVSLDEIGASIDATKVANYLYSADKSVLVERCLDRAFGLYEGYMEMSTARPASGFARAMTFHHLNPRAQAGTIAPMLLQPGYGSLPGSAREQFIARAEPMANVGCDDRCWNRRRYLPALRCDGCCRNGVRQRMWQVA